jgi:hypothetical protein
MLKVTKAKSNGSKKPGEVVYVELAKNQAGQTKVSCAEDTAI